MRHTSHGRPGGHQNKARGGTLLGVFIGLIIGILIALAVVWYINKTPAPFKTPPTTTDSSGASAPAKAGASVGNGSAPVALPGKPGDPPAEKRFQFYDILPGKSEPKPDAKVDPKAVEKAAAPAAVGANGKPEAKASGPLSLQVGSFQTAKDAENMKATLTLMGIEPAVQEVQVNGKQWFRVRVGPLMSFEEINRIKTELGKSGIQAVVVKPNE